MKVFEVTDPDAELPKKLAEEDYATYDAIDGYQSVRELADSNVSASSRSREGSGSSANTTWSSAFHSRSDSRSHNTR